MSKRRIAGGDGERDGSDALKARAVFAALPPDHPQQQNEPKISLTEPHQVVIRLSSGFDL
jgi:hypothetical protein